MKIFQKIAEIKNSELQAMNFAGWYIRQVISVKTPKGAKRVDWDNMIYVVLLETKIDG